MMNHICVFDTCTQYAPGGCKCPVICCEDTYFHIECAPVACSPGSAPDCKCSLGLQGHPRVFQSRRSLFVQLTGWIAASSRTCVFLKEL